MTLSTKICTSKNVKALKIRALEIADRTRAKLEVGNPLKVCNSISTISTIIRLVILGKLLGDNMVIILNNSSIRIRISLS